MAVELKQAIINHLGKNVSAVGFAPVDRLNNAPEMHHPANACREARTVIVFGITVPQGMQYCIKHAIYPIAFKDEQGLKHIERVINTAGYHYGLKCDECLKVCPLNKKKES